MQRNLNEESECELSTAQRQHLALKMSSSEAVYTYGVSQYRVQPS
jgi:hypothetical protein